MDAESTMRGLQMIPERVQLRRTAGWRMPANTVSVARPTKWGNPFRLDSYRADYCDSTERHLRYMATSDFRGLLDGRWSDAYPYPTADLAELAGKNLACWCPLDSPCHADVLLELANREVE